MYITSDELDNKLRSSCRRFTAKLEIDDKQIYTIKSVKLSRGTIGSDTLTICNAVSSAATIIAERLNFETEGKKAALYFIIDNTKIPMGYFKITKAVTKAELTTLTMSDILSNEAEKLYVSSLTFPTTDINVINDICTKLGIRFTGKIQSRTISKNPLGYTYREVLGYIAGKHGKNAVIDREGNLQFVWFQDNGYLLNEDHIAEPEMSYGTIIINSLIVNKSENESYKRGNSQIEINVSNPLIENTDMDEAYASVNGFEYRIASIEMLLGDPRLDPWDIVTYKNNKIPCMDISLEYDGGIKLSIKSVGKTKAESESNTKGPAQKQMERYAIELAAINKAMINKLDAEEASITYATIYDLEVTNEAVMKKISADEADLLYAKITDFEALTGRVGTLEAETIKSTDAIFTNLQSSVAELDTLIFGSASGSTIQTEFANAVIAQLGDAQIKSAMIVEIDAGKIKSGSIYTNKVHIYGDDSNKLSIVDNTIVISDGTYTRVQIGKDNAGDYNMYLWDKSGNLMFDALGLTANGITRKVIRDNVVKDDANISASKLNIDSLFNVINSDNSHTLKSSKIYLNEQAQSLDVAFKSITNSVNGLKSTQSSQGTQISTIQGQITNKIWQQDITTAVDNLEIGGRNLIIENSTVQGWVTNKGTIHKEEGYRASDYISVTPGEELIFQMWLPESAKVWIDDTYFNNEKVYVTGYYGEYITSDYIVKKYVVPDNVSFVRISYSWQQGYKVKLERGNKATDWSPAPEDTENDITTLSTEYSTLDQTVNGLSTTVASHTTQITNKADKSSVTTVSDKVTSLEQNLNGFKTTVSDTYTTKAEFNNLEIGGRNLLYNFSQYTVDNKYSITADKDDTYKVTPGRVKLEAGQKYTFSCKTDGVWGTNGDTVEAYLLMDGGYSKLVRMGNNNGFVFTAPADGEYYLRLDVNKKDITHSFWNVKMEKGNKATDWSPAPEDVNNYIETVETIATQTADKFNWIVKSGTSSTDFTLTDRMASLTAQIISLNGDVKVNGSMIVDGAITANKIATDAIKSKNYVKNTTGSHLNLADGSFDSKNLKWNKYGEVDIKIGNIGGWTIANTLYCRTDTGTAPGAANYMMFQPILNNSTYTDTRTLISFSCDIDSSGNESHIAHEYWHITAGGEFYTVDSIYAEDRIKGGYDLELLTHDNSSSIIMHNDYDRKAYIRIDKDQYLHFVPHTSNGFDPGHGARLNLVTGEFSVLSLTQRSSVRFKENIKEMTDDIADKLDDIKLYSFDYKHNYGDKGQYGVIAEEMINLFPQTVFKSNDGQIESVDYTRLIPIIIKKIQINSKNVNERLNYLDNLVQHLIGLVMSSVQNEK